MLIGHRDNSELLPSRGTNVRQGDEQMIPLFDPSKDDLVVEKWMERVDGLAEQFDWDDRSILRLIASRLRGHARQWYDTGLQVTTTWTETKAGMIQQFRKSVPFLKLFKEAALYKASPGQSLRDYCFQKLNKIRNLDIVIREEYQIDMVIDGIKDDNIARTARAARQTHTKTPFNETLTRELTRQPNENRPLKASLVFIRGPIASLYKQLAEFYEAICVIKIQHFSPSE
ncbi:uncharacterized protein LOC114881970 [Osmia bicornis bicornis]|uniref:uncharacterized protein LOC114881970 n=1 Tax=Osmia bicornis bicornis TaxID=1437191 RepID=UPI001EAF2ADF|nr:uncharacterized protein LOC114881970 [Osmia bicornis bicornis]